VCPIKRNTDFLRAKTMLNQGSPAKHSRLVKVLLNKWLWAAVLILLIWLVWHLLQKGSSRTMGEFGGRNGRNATTVGVATAESADIPIILNALGTVTATATVTVRPQVSGVLQQVNFQEGQMVKAGQLLATIDPREFELALMQSSGQRQRDEAQLDNARLVLARDHALQAQDSIAQQDVEAQAALVKQLEGTVMSDRAQEGTARLNLNYTKVVAPVSGRVGLRSVDVGNLVSAGDTTGIAVIAQLAPIDVVFSVPQIQVSDIQNELNSVQEQTPSLAAALKVTALDRSRANVLAEGQFLALDNQVDVQTGTVRAKARFANEKLQLFPNEFVNIKFVLRNIKDAVVVPISALRHGTNGDYVYVLDSESNTVALRLVSAGQADVDRVQITNGLQAGEKIITEGADKLKDGATVKLASNIPDVGGDPAKAGANREGRNKDWRNKNGANPDGSHKEWRKRSGANSDAASSEGSTSENASSESAASSESSSRSGEHRHKRPEAS
jgi:multidrug efflux system membrane fusion protein